MRKAEQRGWTKATAPCYVEKHHVFIKAIFGENDRVVYLTAREHFIAHMLLWNACRKRYGVQHRKTAKTGKAFHSMSMKSKYTKERHVPNSREFEMARIANSESMLGDNHWSKQEGAVSPFVELNKDPVRAKRIGEINGKREKERWVSGDHPWQTPEFVEGKIQRMVEGQAAEMGAKTKGKLWWNNGVEQTRAFECPGEGWVNKRLAFPVNTNRSPEATENRRKAQIGKKQSAETKQSISRGVSEARRKK